MTPRTFFEKFELFADAPGGVAKLREIVLDLAVRGRLLGDPTDGNADGIQKSWQQRQLGDVAHFINGDRSKNYPSKSFRVDKGVPFINAGHLSNGDVELTNMDYIPPEHFNRLGGGKVEPGDVLYCLRGSLGKCAVVQSIQRGAIASSLLIIRPSKEITSRFIYLFLVSPLGARMIAKYDNGSAQPNLSAANVKKYALPLPPLAEQKRIVAKVDALMALCDRLEAQQQERETRHAALARASLACFADAPTPANLDFIFHPSYAITPADLRKSILTLAVQGKLVPQDPCDEQAEASSESDALFEIPASWQWRLLGSLGLCRTGKTPPTSDPTNYGAGFPFVGPGQITASGNFTAPEKTITSKGLENSTEANLSDILMVCIGGSIGKAAICCEPLGFNQQINSMRLKRDLAEFVYLAVTSQYFQEQVLANASGSATPIINKGKWERIPVPIPPLPEQRRIVAKVDQLMALVDTLEAQLATSRASASNLLSALVAEITAPAHAGS